MPIVSTTLASTGPSSTPVLWLRGEHDMTTAGQVEDAVRRLASGTAAEVVIDLSDVDFMDASIIRVLVAVAHELAAAGRSLVLRSPSRSARRLLGLCGLDGAIRSFTKVSAVEARIGWMEATALPRVAHATGQAIITEVVRGVPRAFEPIAS